MKMENSSKANNKVQAVLEKLFSQHRLVFWYDDTAEMTELFQSLQMTDVEKVTIQNNEFTLKHKIVLEHPNQKFLLYQPKPKPIDNENWLLDLLLSNYEFRTEASSLYLQELELPQEFKSLIQQYEDFFSSEKRITELKAILEPEDRESKIQLKMLSILTGAEPEWEKIMYALFAEILKTKEDKFKAIEKFGLSTFLWETIEKRYDYKSNNASIKDFLLQLIQDNYERSIVSGKPLLNKEGYLFVNRWKENTKAKQIFNDWSLKLEADLGIENKLNTILVQDVLEADTYPIIDKKIIVELRDHIINNTLANHSVQEWIEKRKVKFFYTDFNQIYNALSNASILLDEIRKVDIKIKNPQDGFEKYEKQWYKIDSLYRKYILASEKAEHQNLLKNLTTQIEKAYGNSFLLKLGDVWQKNIDKLTNWEIENTVSQKQFYQNWIEPYTKKDNRIFVIISDALRYESAAELKDIILQQDKYTAKLSAVLGSIPSYTQLGMASLLPNEKITFEDKSEIVYVDGISSQGTSNRTKILQKRFAGSTAILAEDFLKFNSKTDGRDFVKPYNIIYIYSNHIDKIGDDKTSEGKVFQETETEFEYLLKIIKHIYNMNGYNMIVTADHGYLYQHNRLDQTDFTDFTPSGEIYKSSRRFVIGKELSANQSVQKWKANSLGFSDDTEVIIPNSINRIRIQGAGSRFVHGGSSLQEIVIPVIEINNARKKNILQVDVDIISGSSNITSNSFAVNFYQKQPTADKIHSRQIKAAFYTTSGKLISDVNTLLFNSTDSDALSREKRQTFLFNSDASKYNGQDVYLKLEEQIDGTNQFKTYKSISYRMLIAFSSEFDD
jgi:uncharacterized protein (TIGR02687 family)